MHHWTKGIMGDDPPYLAVGTEVSAKYKGAFCEAKVRKVVRSVKCKVTFKLGLGAAVVADDQVRGTLRVGAVCEVKHPEKKEFVQATINKITDSSQYTVVFDDGDITTLRRTALCLKSGRHFAVSETLDQLPLTHPEHFSNPVIGGRKGRRSRQAQDDTSDEEDTAKRGVKKKEKEADIGRVVSVELGDKKKQKDNWFPGLVVAPTAQDTVRIRVRDEYLVRSFKDGRYFTVPKKEASEFSRELGSKAENNSLKAAVEKALLFLDRDELPPHWDRDVLFGVDESSAVSDSDGALDSDSSDDEPTEEKDHFVAQLYKFMDDRGTPINNEPTVCNKDLDLYKLFKVVHKLGGYNRVTNQNQWKTIARKVGFDQGGPSIKNLVKQAYKKFLHSFEEFYRKLGCTMVNHPRQGRHGGRSLIRDRDRATPVHVLKEKAGPSGGDSLSESPDYCKQEAGCSETSADESTKGKADDRRSTLEKLFTVEDKPKGVKEEKNKDANIVSEKTLIKDDLPKKEKELKNVAKPDTKEVKKDTVKNQKETKKEKLVEEKVKGGEVVKEKSGNKIVKEADNTDSTVPVKEIPLKSSPVQVKVEVPEKTLVEVKKESKPKDDKSKRLRDSKAKLPRQTSSEHVEIQEAGDDQTSKVREQEKEESDKSSEDEKSDNSKRRGIKKEDEEKQTRSKSKEDLNSKSDSDRRSRDFDKPSTPRPKKPDDEEEPKKRGRKRKDADKPNQEEALGQLAAGIAVGVGDKLKVYYGPTHESKVTYEAKVIEVEKETYLVHYTGWNTRYDEWIKRGRIAENLSWTPSRAKRLRLQQAKASAKSPKPVVGKRGRPSLSGRDSAMIPRPRSTTPSSVTSSSSRTKSPGTPAPRTARPMPGPDYRRRTRKMSGHTDISLPSELSSESEDSESDAEPVVPMRRRSERGEKEENKRLLRRKPVSMKEADVDDEAEEDSGEQSSAVSDPQQGKRRSARTRKPLNSTPDRKDDEQKQDGTESDEEQIQPKGRDFDLNQIRSELKGIEKAVKLPQDLGTTSDGKDSSTVLDAKSSFPEVSRLSAEKDVVTKVTEVKKIVAKPQESKGSVTKLEAKSVICKTGDAVLAKTSLGDSDHNVAVPEVTASVSKTEDVKHSVSPAKGGSKGLELGKNIVKTPETQIKSSVKASENLAKTSVKGVKTSESVSKTSAKTSEVMGKGGGKSPETSGKSVKSPEVLSKAISKPTESSGKAVTKPAESPGKVNISQPEASSSTDDIYEFKEPEPFEFEVRAKREPVLVEDRVKSPRKSTKEIIAVEVSPIKDKAVKSPLSRKKLLRNASAKSEGKDVSPTVKKRVKRDVATKVEVPAESKKEAAKVPPESADPVTPPKNLPTSACEEAFDKLCESPVFRPAMQRRLSAAGEIEPLSLFGELPGEGREDGDDDQEDRLVISETDENDAESGEPLFTYSQRHHEELLPTLTSDISSVSVLREKFSGDLPQNQLPSVLATFNKSTDLSTSGLPLVRITQVPRRASVKSPTLGSSPIPKESSPAAISHATIVKVASPARTSVSSPVSSKKDDSIVPSKDASKKDVFTVPSKDAGTSLQESEKKLEQHGTKESDEEEFEEDPISAAIQRVISQAVTDEDSDEIAPTTLASSDKAPLRDPPISTAEQLKRDSLKRKIGARKPVLSQEFVEDSSSDSSDEEQRLVIDKIDDDDNSSLQEEEIRPAVPLKRPAESPVQPASGQTVTNSKFFTTKKLAVTREAKHVAEESTKQQAGLSKEVKKIVEKGKEDQKVTEKLVRSSAEPVQPPVQVKTDEQSSNLVDDKSRSNAVSVIQSSEASEPQRAAEDCKVEEEVADDLSLLCEETIPGSPTPVPESHIPEPVRKAETSDSRSMILEMPFASAPGSSVMGLPVKPSASVPDARAAELAARLAPAMCARNVDEASTVLENTPPTTPDSSLSVTSGSPREERLGLSPTMDMDFKSREACFEDSSAEGHKEGHYSEDDSLLNIEVSNSSLQDVKQQHPKKLTNFDSPSPKKRQRSRKRSECESNKRSKASARATRGNVSDSDDTSENSGPLNTSDVMMMSSRSPRPSRYNFYVELDPELDGSQRIALLQQKLQELRKTYLTLKSELACIDRRRKKLRRREREEKSTKQEVTCA